MKTVRYGEILDLQDERYAGERPAWYREYNQAVVELDTGEVYVRFQDCNGDEDEYRWLWLVGRTEGEPSTDDRKDFDPGELVHVFNSDLEMIAWIRKKLIGVKIKAIKGG